MTEQSTSDVELKEDLEEWKRMSTVEETAYCALGHPSNGKLVLDSRLTTYFFLNLPADRKPKIRQRHEKLVPIHSN